MYLFISITMYIVISNYFKIGYFSLSLRTVLNIRWMSFNFVGGSFSCDWCFVWLWVIFEVVFWQVVDSFLQRLRLNGKLDETFMLFIFNFVQCFVSVFKCFYILPFWAERCCLSGSEWKEALRLILDMFFVMILWT